MKRIVLLLLALNLHAAHAVEEMPSKFRAACERMLLNRGWKTAPVRAQINLTDGEVQEIEGSRMPVIAVSLNGSNNPIRYARTARNVSELIGVDPHYPRRFFTLENFQGKKVLDLACGEGRAVEDLRREGVDVVGLDIHLTPYMLSKPYFIKASAHKTGLPSESFDIIYSTQGPFIYLDDQPAMMEALMKEAHRILKKGGVLRLSPVIHHGDFTKHGARPEIDLRDTIYTNLPHGMRLKSWPDQWWFVTNDPGEGGHIARYWLEIEKYD